MDGYDGDLTPEFEQYQAELLRYAYYLTRNKAQAEDLVGNAWYKFLLNIEHIEQARQKFWLLRVIHNDFIDGQRKQKKWRFTPFHELTSNDQPVTPAVARELEMREDRERILGLIAGLRHPYREVIFHFYYSEMTIKELQQFFGMSSGQIKTILYRGRKMIKEVLLASENEES